MCSGLRKACSTARAPGASRNTAASAPSTMRVLAVEMTVALRPPPSSREPRPLRSNEPGDGQSGTPDVAPGGPPTAGSPPAGSAAGPGWLSSMPAAACQPQGWMVAKLKANGTLQELQKKYLQSSVGLQLGDRLVDAAHQ